MNEGGLKLVSASSCRIKNAFLLWWGCLFPRKLSFSEVSRKLGDGNHTKPSTFGLGFSRVRIWDSLSNWVYGCWGTLGKIPQANCFPVCHVK